VGTTEFYTSGQPRRTRLADLVAGVTGATAALMVIAVVCAPGIIRRTESGA